MYNVTITAERFEATTESRRAGRVRVFTLVLTGADADDIVTDNVIDFVADLSRKAFEELLEAMIDHNPKLARECLTSLAD